MQPDGTDFRVEQFARARTVMARCNRALVRAREEQSLLEEMCRIVVESGGYRMAWIGLVRHDEARTIEPAASAGHGVEYLRERPFTWADRVGGGGPAGKAVRSGQPQAVQDMATHPSASAELRELALQRQFRAQVALPLIYAGETLGVLGIFAEEPTAFESDEIILLDELSDDIAFGLNGLRMRASLHASEQRFETTFAQAAVGLAQVALDGTFVRVNDKICEYFRARREDLVGRTYADLTWPEDLVPDSPVIKRLLAGESSVSFEKRYRRFDGTALWASITVSVGRNADGEPDHFINVMTDISESRLAQQALREYARQQELIAGFGQLALGNADLDHLMHRAVEVATEALGLPYGKILQLGPDGQSLTLKASRGWNTSWMGTAVTTLADSHAGYVLAENRPVVVEDFNGETRFTPSPMVLAHGVASGVAVVIGNEQHPHGVLGVHAREPRHFSAQEVNFLSSVANSLATVIERRHAEERLAYLAQFDTITRLPNRNLLRDRLEHSLQQARRRSWTLGVLFIDLDRFKYVNDTLGHSVGDQLLVLVAERLNGAIRQGDTVGRLGGDEFAIVLSELKRANDASVVSQKLLRALSEPFDLNGHETYISASLGIATFPEDGSDPETLLKNADTAMYRAKEQGRNNFQFYVPQLNERATRRLQLETRLRGALDRGEFSLVYQPKADLRSGRISGFEALLRWTHEELGAVSPSEFMPILEDTGLVLPVGEWVLRTACAFLRRWVDERLEAVPIAVNLSPRQFGDRRLDHLLQQMTHEAGVDPWLLEIEITESMLMHEPEEAIAMMRRLRAAGLKLAVDDFGTGYSSLAYLQRFPISALKIDRAFVKEVVNRRGDAQIAVAIIDLAHNLELEVIAEGVETAEQAEFLRDNDCDHVQGYWFSAPLDAEHATRALAENLILPALPEPAMSLLRTGNAGL